MQACRFDTNIDESVDSVREGCRSSWTSSPASSRAMRRYSDFPRGRCFLSPVTSPKRAIAPKSRACMAERGFFGVWSCRVFWNDEAQLLCSFKLLWTSRSPDAKTAHSLAAHCSHSRDAGYRRGECKNEIVGRTWIRTQFGSAHRKPRSL